MQAVYEHVQSADDISMVEVANAIAAFTRVLRPVDHSLSALFTREPLAFRRSFVNN